MKRDSFGYRILAKMFIITEAGGGYIGLDYIIHPTFVYLKFSITKLFYRIRGNKHLFSTPQDIQKYVYNVFNMKIFLKIH